MFCSWVVVFIFQLVRFTISRDVELQSSTGATSELSNKRDPPRSKFEMFDFKKFGPGPQVVEDTFNIKSWGFGTTERKMLMDIKTRVDSLSASCKGMSTFWVELNAALHEKILIHKLNIFGRLKLLLSSLFQGPLQSVLMVGFRSWTHVTWSSTSQHWNGVTLDELVRIWAEILPSSKLSLRTNLSLSWWRGKGQSHIWVCGLASTEQQTTNSTGWTVLQRRHGSILLGQMTIHTLSPRSVCTCTEMGTSKESGVTSCVTWTSRL